MNEIAEPMFRKGSDSIGSLKMKDRKSSSPKEVNDDEMVLDFSSKIHTS